MSERTQRVSEVIRREISSLIQKQVELEGVLITVSGVEVTPDLKTAFVYLSMIEQGLTQSQGLSRLNRFKPRWQSEIGKRLEAKFTPRIQFRFDKAQGRGDRVMEVMIEIERQQENEARLRGELPKEAKEQEGSSSDDAV